MKFLLTLSAAVLYMSLIQCDFINTEVDSTGECSGSIMFEGNPSLKFSSDNTLIRGLRVTTVLKEGCGCFRIHSRKNGKGKSKTLIKNKHYTLNIGRVRSLFKITCP